MTITPNQERVLKLLREPGCTGYTVERIAALFHWPTHIVRAAIAELDGAGYLIPPSKHVKVWRAK